VYGAKETHKVDCVDGRLSTKSTGLNSTLSPVCMGPKKHTRSTMSTVDFQQSRPG